MNNESAIQEELKELNSSLAEVSRTLPYSLPDEYFAIFEQNITAIVAGKEDNEAALAGIEKAMPFSVPQGYFDHLTHNVVTQVTGLNMPAKAGPYEVPDNYFTAFPDRVLQAAQAMDQPKTHTIPASNFVFKHIRLAAAAVLLLCIGLGAYTTLFNSDYRSPEMMLRSVPKTEIQAYLENSEKSEPENIVAGNLAFDSKDIVVYLNETGWE